MERLGLISGHRIKLTITAPKKVTCFKLKIFAVSAIPKPQWISMISGILRANGPKWGEFHTPELNWSRMKIGPDVYGTITVPTSSSLQYIDIYLASARYLQCSCKQWPKDFLLMNAHH